MVKLENRLNEEDIKKRRKERKEDVRGAFFRDTTAIIHSSAFRRLKHKTQVFYAPSNDHICTRMEHVLHVASIASTISRGLGLDSELAWAIGMGHDLGHTPFGHTGERIISSFSEQRGLGKFEHEVNSLRVVDFLSGNGSGLNLTYAVRDGIVSHNGESLSRTMEPTFTVKNLDEIKSRRGLVPSTYEGVIVRFSDFIAYLGRDYEDALRLGIIREDELPAIVKDRIGTSNSQIIDALIGDIMDSSSPERGISFSFRVFDAVRAFSDFNYEHIYRSRILEGYSKYFYRVLKLITDYLEELYRSAGTDGQLYAEERNMLAAGFYNHICEMKKVYDETEGDDRHLVIDYCAGMTDNFALDSANEILKPEHLNDEIDQSQTGKWFDRKKF